MARAKTYLLFDVQASCSRRQRFPGPPHKLRSQQATGNIEFQKGENCRIAMLGQNKTNVRRLLEEVWNKGNLVVAEKT
jgi:hypothetical protein